MNEELDYLYSIEELNEVPTYEDYVIREYFLDADYIDYNDVYYDDAYFNDDLYYPIIERYKNQ